MSAIFPAVANASDPKVIWLIIDTLISRNEILRVTIQDAAKHLSLRIYWGRIKIPCTPTFFDMSATVGANLNGTIIWWWVYMYIPSSSHQMAIFSSETNRKRTFCRLIKRHILGSAERLKQKKLNYRLSMKRSNL